MSLRRLEAVRGKDHDRPKTGAIFCLADFAGLAYFLETVVRAAPGRIAGGVFHEPEAVVVLEVGPRDFHDAAGPNFHAVFIKHHFLSLSALPSSGRVGRFPATALGAVSA